MKNYTLNQIALFLAGCIASLNCFGELIVVGDHGGVPTNIPTKAKMQAQAEQFKKEQRSLGPRRIDANDIMEYPLESSLTLGVLSPRAHRQPVKEPFFILSNDSESLKWFTANKQALFSMRAIGFATHIATRDDFVQLKNRIAPIELRAVPLDMIITQFSLTRFPVLITQHEIIQ